MKEKIKISFGIGICIVITFLIGVCFYISIYNKNEVEINKTYSEIIDSLDVNNFDKNKFSGEFVIKKVNNLVNNILANEIDYYNINGELVDEYVPETVLATWDDISNYESDLYKGLNLSKEIPYSSYMIYRNDLPNETIFYLEANKTEYSANETIKDTFNKNNVGLFWSNKTSNTIQANEIISVPTELRKKWNDNELGIFIELLGEPSRIYKMPDISKDEFFPDTYKTEFDVMKDYYLYWEYDEYYIRMRINYMMDGKTEKNSYINQVIVHSKDSNSRSGDYKKEISWGEEYAEKIFSIKSN